MSETSEGRVKDSAVAPPASRCIKRYLPAVLAAAACVLLTVVAFRIARRMEQKALRMGLERRTRDCAMIFQYRLDTHLEILYSVGSFFDASEVVTRQEFHEFTKHTLARCPGLLSLRWAPRVAREERAAFEQAARAEGFPNFHITEVDSRSEMVPATDRPEYFPFFYLEPLEKNIAVLGLDPSTGPNSGGAMRKALELGSPTATRCIRLVVCPDRPLGIVAFLPVYQKGLHDTSEKRRSALAGFASAVFRVDDIIHEAVSEDVRDHLDFVIRDVTDSEPTVVYASGEHLEARPIIDGRAASLRTTLPLAVVDRRWELEFRPTEHLLREHRLATPWAVLIGGLVFSALLASYLVTIAGRTECIRNEVAMRTAALRQEISHRERVENTLRETGNRYQQLFRYLPISLWEEDFSKVKRLVDALRASGVEDLEAYFRDHPQEGEKLSRAVRILEVNQATLDMYEASSKDELLSDLTPVFARESYDLFIPGVVGFAQGKRLYEGETVNRTLTGRILQIYVRASIAPGSEDTWSRVLVSIVDISERRRALAVAREQRDLAIALSNAHDLDEAARAAVHTALRLSETDCGALYVQEPDCDEMVLAYSTGLSEAFISSVARFGRGTSLSGTNNYVPTEHRDLYLREGFAAVGIVPIMHEGRAVGSLNVASRTLRDLTLEARHALEAVAAQAGGALVRLQAQNSLRRSEQRFRSLIEFASDIVVVLDPGGVFQYLSPATRTIMGYEPDEMVGKNAFDFIHPDDAESVRRVFERRIQIGGVGEPIEFRFRHRDGSWRYLEAIGSYPDQAVGLHGMVVNARDVTERRHLLEMTRRQRDLAADLNATDSLDKAVRMCVQSAMELGDMDCGGLHLLNSRTGGADLIFSVGVSMDFVTAMAHHPPGSFYVKTVLTGQPYYITVQDVPDPNLLPLLREGLQYFGFIPILHEGRVIAALEVASHIRTEATEAERNAMETVAALVGGALARIQAERTIRDQMDFLQRLIDTIPSPVLYRDADGFIRQVNAALLEVIPIPKEELIGKKYADVLPEDAARRVQKLDQEMLEHPRTQVSELTFRHPDGSLHDYMSCRAPYCDAHGRVLGIVSVGVDITELKRTQRELHVAKEAAEDASRAKSQFLANVSHEIRTPLHGLLGMLDLVAASELQPEQRQYLDAARSCARTLQALMEDLLDLARIETGRFELQLQPFSLRQTVAEAVRTMALEATERGLELVCSIEASVPDALIGDPQRLRQVLINLLNNAVKFTEQGHVLLSVRTHRVESDSAELLFDVADSGIGIPEDKQKVIFDIFAQLDPSTTRRHGSTGLGLPISAQLVRLMGGQISVRSQVGKGSTFSFTARFGLQSSPQADQPAPAALMGKRILVADDRAVSRRILAAALSEWGCLCTAVENGLLAWNALRGALDRSELFDLVLIDIHMPVMDGLDLIERIRSDTTLKALPVIALVLPGHTTCHARAFELGASAVLLKPTLEAELLTNVTMALGIPSRKPESPSAISGTTTRRPLRILVAEDDDLSRQMLTRLLINRGHIVEPVATGRQAIDLLLKRQFDVVLLDIQMPDIDGYETAQAIRQQEQKRGGHITIIAITAFGKMGNRERCIRAGMDGYVPKPFDPAALFETVERLASEPPDPPAQPAESSPIDRDALFKRCMGDPEIVAEMIQIFREDVNERLQKIRDAVARGDAPALSAAAHALKGSAGNISAQGVRDAAAKLEALGMADQLAEARDAMALLEREIRRAMAALDELSPPTAGPSAEQ